MQICIKPSHLLTSVRWSECEQLAASGGLLTGSNSREEGCKSRETFSSFLFVIAQLATHQRRWETFSDCPDLPLLWNHSNMCVCVCVCASVLLHTEYQNTYSTRKVRTLGTFLLVLKASQGCFWVQTGGWDQVGVCADGQGMCQVHIDCVGVSSSQKKNTCVGISQS